MQKVSVIIPVYNVEKYISRCLDSVLNQSYRNIEIILIDDCSTDNSLSICKKYAHLDDRIRLLSLEKNSGVSHARNIALTMVTGNYITFLDSDDYLDSNTIEVSLEALTASNADMVIFNKKLLHRNKDIELYEEVNSNDTYESFLKKLLCRTIPTHICGKLYKKQVWENLTFTENVLLEDLLIYPDLLKNIKNIVCLSDYFYYYDRTNPSSIINNYSNRIYYFEFIGMFNLLKMYESFSITHGFYDTMFNKTYKYAIKAYLNHIISKNLSHDESHQLYLFLNSISSNNNCLYIRNKIYQWTYTNFPIALNLYSKILKLQYKIKN